MLITLQTVFIKYSFLWIGKKRHVLHKLRITKGFPSFFIKHFKVFIVNLTQEF